MSEINWKSRSVIPGEAGAPLEPSSEIVELYQKLIPEYLTVLNATLESDDQEAIMFQCHKISSAVKFMGFDNIGALLDKVQTERPQGPELVKLCQRVVKQVEHTLILLEK